MRNSDPFCLLQPKIAYFGMKNLHGKMVLKVENKKVVGNIYRKRKFSILVFVCLYDSRCICRADINNYF